MAQHVRRGSSEIEVTNAGLEGEVLEQRRLSECPRCLHCQTPLCCAPAQITHWWSGHASGECPGWSGREERSSVRLAAVGHNSFHEPREGSWRCFR